MKGIILSSGGIDSTTCVGLAIDELGVKNVVSVSVYYGQKHDKELKCAENIARHYDIEHYTLDLSEVMKFSNCSLLKNSTEKIKHKTYKEQIEENGKVDSYVPFRNGLFLSAVAALATSIYPDDTVKVYIGAHADDAAENAYADCSTSFINAMSEAINIGTYGNVRLTAPFVEKTKSEVVKCGLELNVPYELTWSCYEGEDKQCGVCGTCRDRKKAFELNNDKDPVPYSE